MTESTVGHDDACREICKYGHRLYHRGFAAANDGNLSVRVGPNEVLCTPSLCCKGDLTPADLCLVDMYGQQLAGSRPRSSEVQLHLEVYRRRSDVQSVVHCHPPHATAFAVARAAIPQGVLPEVELFLGEVPIARYETPGTKEFAATVAPFVEHASVVVLANHGTVSWGESVERAYWPTEILDAYCRILLLAKQLGGVQFLPDNKVRELVESKRGWGFADPRHGADFAGDVAGNATFRHTWSDSGTTEQAFARDRNAPTGDSDQESLIATIVRRVVAELQR